VDNIEKFVARSRKVLMVFSRHFARSPWCQYELTFCLSHLIDCDDVLVVVMLGRMEPDDDVHECRAADHHLPSLAEAGHGTPRVLAQAQSRLSGDKCLTMFTITDVMFKINYNFLRREVHSIHTL
jgi:hypothetical protein